MEQNMKENKDKRSFWKDEAGEVGVKQIAWTVGVIIIVGFVVTVLSDGRIIGEWLNDIWKILRETLEKLSNSES
ncbi:hypothetical protein [Paenibacillus caui]|uniref:hypothetical protein n=1 Tax=Paenibacillus caui TaxID=2873927 RepID=UPI001CA9D03C|nr:hypothetical protein [Paenibacillus caui]